MARNPNSPPKGFSKAEWDKMLDASDVGSATIRAKLDAEAKKVSSQLHRLSQAQKSSTYTSLNKKFGGNLPTTDSGRRTYFTLLKARGAVAKTQMADNPRRKQQERTARAKIVDRAHVAKGLLQPSMAPTHRASPGPGGEQGVRGALKQKPMWNKGSQPMQAIRQEMATAGATPGQIVHATAQARIAARKARESEQGSLASRLTVEARPPISAYVDEPGTGRKVVPAKYYETNARLPKLSKGMRKDGKRRGMLKPGEIDTLLKRATHMTSSGKSIGDQLIHEGTPKPTHRLVARIAGEMSEKLDTIANSSKYNPPLRGEAQRLSSLLNKQRNDAIAHVKSTERQAGIKIERTVVGQALIDEDYDYANAARKHGGPTGRDFSSNMSPRQQAAKFGRGKAPVPFGVHHIPGNLANQALNLSGVDSSYLQAREFGPHPMIGQTRHPMALTNVLERGVGAKNRHFVNVLHPSFAGVVRRITGETGRMGVWKYQTSKILRDTQRFGLELSEKLGLAPGLIPTHLFPGLMQAVNATDHTSMAPTTMSATAMQRQMKARGWTGRAMGGKSSVTIHAVHIGTFDEAKLLKLSQSGELLIDMDRHFDSALRFTATQPVAGKHYTGERIHGALPGGGRNVFTTSLPMAGGSLSAQIFSPNETSFAVLSTSGAGDDLRRQIKKQRMKASGMAGMLRRDPTAFAKSLMKGMKETWHVMPNESVPISAEGMRPSMRIVNKTVGGVRGSYVARRVSGNSWFGLPKPGGKFKHVMYSVSRDTPGAIPMTPTARGLRLPHGLSSDTTRTQLLRRTPVQERDTGLPNFESSKITGHSRPIPQGGIGKGVESRAAAFAKIPPHRTERTYGTGLIVTQISDESNMERLEASFVSILEDGTDVLTTTMYQGALEVFSRRGIEPRWMPNSSWTKMRKGGDSPGLETGALVRALKVVGGKNKLTGSASSGNISMERELGWDNTPHPVDADNLRQNDDKPYTMAQLATLNEFGGSVAKQADGTPFVIPSRPWLSRAADLFGMKSLDMTAKYLGQRISAYGFTPKVVSSMAAGAFQGRGSGTVSHQLPKSAFATMRGVQTVGSGPGVNLYNVAGRSSGVLGAMASERVFMQSSGEDAGSTYPSPSGR